MRVGQNTAPFAQFCDETTLIAEIGSDMCTELDKGNAVVSIATGTHRRLLERQLTAHGINIVAALGAGQYVSLNALEALSTIIVDDVPDVVRFAEVVGAIIDRTATHYRRVLIFGELVPLMHADGKHAGALKLDTLWRSFVASRPIFLHCECPALAIHTYSSISFAHRAVSRDIPRTWAVVAQLRKPAVVTEAQVVREASNFEFAEPPTGHPVQVVIRRICAFDEIQIQTPLGVIEQRPVAAAQPDSRTEDQVRLAQ